MTMTDREKALAKRAGNDGEAWIAARQKSPGMTLLEFRTLTGRKGSNAVELDLPTTVDAPAPAKKTTAKKTAAKKKASGSPAPK